MKYLLIILLCFSLNRDSNAQWFWQNPLPTNNTLNSVVFADPLNGIAVGQCGTIIQTADGGKVVYDILGKGIMTLVNEEKPTGSYKVEFDASDLSSGVYIYRIQAKDFLQARKMLLIK